MAGERETATAFGRGANHDEGEPDGSHFLLLSVFLILLGFFALLTASARFDEVRSSDLIVSLQSTFRGWSGPRSPVFPGETGIRALPGDPGITALDAAFTRDWALAIAGDPLSGEGKGYVLFQQGGTANLRLPAESLFVSGAAALRSGRDGLMSALARVLSQKPDAGRRVLVSVPRMPRARLDQRRAARLSGRLEQLGVAPGIVRVQVRRDQGHDILFRFFAQEGKQ